MGAKPCQGLQGDSHNVDYGNFFKVFEAVFRARQGPGGPNTCFGARQVASEYLSAASGGGIEAAPPAPQLR
jgi:hypothetical protein